MCGGGNDKNSPFPTSIHYDKATHVYKMIWKCVFFSTFVLRNNKKWKPMKIFRTKIIPISAKLTNCKLFIAEIVRSHEKVLIDTFRIKVPRKLNF